MVKSIARMSIGGRKGIALRQIAGKFGQADQGRTYNYPVGSWTFVPPKAGYWKFVLWGPGGGQHSGAYVEKTVFLAPNKSATIVVGKPGTNTTVTLPGGTVLTAGAATSVGGVATGGDVNLDGSTNSAPGTGASGPNGAGTGGGAGGAGDSVSNDGGAGAPANLPFRGGKGLSAGGTYSYVETPGGGQSTLDIGMGAGLAIVLFVRP